MNEWNVTTEHPRNSSSLLTHTMDIHKPNILLSWKEMTLCRYQGNGFILLMIFTLCRMENALNWLTVRFITWPLPAGDIRISLENSLQPFGIIFTYRAYISPFAVFLNENDRNYVEPDISVICDQNKLNDKGCVGAPDWIIEIVSPSSRPMDYNKKLFKYRTAGVREYWIVDHDKDRITVYHFEPDDLNEYSFTDNVPVGIYPGFSINLSKLYIWPHTCCRQIISEWQQFFAHPNLTIYFIEITLNICYDNIARW